MNGDDYFSHIKRTRSIRFFQDREVPDELVRKIIECAAYSPSTHNSEPWRYYIVKSNEEKEKLKENKAFKQHFVYQAPVIIISAINPKEKGCLSKETLKIIEDWNCQRTSAMIQNEAIAMQVIHEAASAYGLGSCIIGLLKPDVIKRVLDIPIEYITNLALAVGYPELESHHEKFRTPKELILNQTILKE